VEHVCAVVATDDERIVDCCREFGAEVIMTSETCQNGTFLLQPHLNSVCRTRTQLQFL
jgi:CMP-2-keto-3-deoxyoctulosonic acid synthetase